MKSEPLQARLLDLTRLARRAGRLPTGIDRVELAYFHHLLSDPVPLFACVRTRLGYLLLDQDGLHQLLKTPLCDRAQAERRLRKLAIARTIPQGWPRLLRRHFPNGFSYVNVGHSNLTQRVLSGIKAAGGRIAVMLHDVIPLEYPQFQRAGTPEKFAQMLTRIDRFADVILCNSQDTATRARNWLRNPDLTYVVAHLGVERVTPKPVALPPGLAPDRPYFVTLGTIEPRKRHDLLLSCWQELRQDGAVVPALLICGRRGWNNEAVFRTLDNEQGQGDIFEFPELSDGEIAGLLAGAQALLFPSDAEGYGLPALEAAQYGTPILCQRLPVFEELLQERPVYLEEVSGYQLAKNIRTILRGTSLQGSEQSIPGFEAPSWRAHFNTVLSKI